MKIIADDNIPLVENYFGPYGDLILKPGRTMTYQDVKSADILLVRSVTRVDQSLLQDTRLKFLGSAVTGIDHLDAEFLARAQIPWAAATGCNATAVVEYAVTIVAALQSQGILVKNPLRAGIIGAGRIGSQVAEKLLALGCEVLQCDPPRAEVDENFISTPLAEFRDLDFISLHTPLTREGAHPTHHLIAKKFLQQQKKDCVILNTGRGAVIDFHDLKQYGKHLIWCLDVWENEPDIDLEVLESAAIATPHIAGYSLQSKPRATYMLYQAARKLDILPGPEVALVPYPSQIIACDKQTMDWGEVLLKIFDPVKTSTQMKKMLSTKAATFDELRKCFVDRCEFEFVIFRNDLGPVTV
jgi:erythronate-4-phosphate dehydrogenase